MFFCGSVRLEGVGVCVCVFVFKEVLVCCWLVLVVSGSVAPGGCF